MKNLIDHNKTEFSETLKNKEFMKWLKDEKFDVAFPHMYSLCAVGLVRAAEIPTWVWLNRFCYKNMSINFSIIIILVAL